MKHVLGKKLLQVFIVKQHTYKYSRYLSLLIANKIRHIKQDHTHCNFATGPTFNLSPITNVYYDKPKSYE